MIGITAIMSITTIAAAAPLLKLVGAGLVVVAFALTYLLPLRAREDAAPGH
jgi:hypothetical protein